MVKKKCIFFDNEDQSDTIERLKREALAKGLDIDCEQFNVGSTEYTEFLTNGEIDIEKVVKQFNQKFKGTTFHLAVFDWNLDDDKIDGIELIRQLTAHKVLVKTPKIVISAKLKIILNDIVRAEENRRIEKLSLLINSNIRDYKERDEYQKDIILFFLKEEESLDLIIEEELKKFPDFIFENNFVNEKFNGKSYKEISEILEENELIRNEFKREIIQQTIAYLTTNI